MKLLIISLLLCSTSNIINSDFEKKFITELQKEDGNALKVIVRAKPNITEDFLQSHLSTCLNCKDFINKLAPTSHYVRDVWLCSKISNPAPNNNALFPN